MAKRNDDMGMSVVARVFLLLLLLVFLGGMGWLVWAYVPIKFLMIGGALLFLVITASCCLNKRPSSYVPYSLE